MSQQNVEKLRDIFAEVLKLDKEHITDDLKYTEHRWDSVAHVAIVNVMEQDFEVFLDTDQVIDMSSFKKAREILASHGVDI